MPDITGRTTEVADGVFQISTHVEGANLNFQQYLITGDEPTLFHTGLLGLFPVVRDAVASVIPVESLRWITFGHYEADECGSMNEWLAVAPHAEVRHSMIGLLTSVNDVAARPPVMHDAGTFDTGGHTLRWIDTPHLPHGWDAGVLYDETTKTLFCGDLFTQVGALPAMSDQDTVGPAIATEDIFHASCLAPTSGAQLRDLATLPIDRLALMHGPVFTGDCKAALVDLAADFDRRIAS